MALAITCPGCHATLHARDEYAGKEMKCPRCSAIVPVPAEQPPTAAIQEARPEPAIQEARPAPALARAAEHPVGDREHQRPVLLVDLGGTHVVVLSRVTRLRGRARIESTQTDSLRYRLDR